MTLKSASRSSESFWTRLSLLTRSRDAFGENGHSRRLGALITRDWWTTRPLIPCVPWMQGGVAEFPQSNDALTHCSVHIFHSRDTIVLPKASDFASVLKTATLESRSRPRSNASVQEFVNEFVRTFLARRLQYRQVMNDDAGFCFSPVEIALVRGSLNDACRVAVALIEAHESVSEVSNEEKSNAIDAATLAPKR